MVYFARLDRGVLLIALLIIGALSGVTSAAQPLRLEQLLPQQKLIAPDLGEGDALGWLVALDGTTAMVSAVYDDDKGLDTGAVYVYNYDGATWNFAQKLTASDAAVDQEFGVAIAIQGDTAMISAVYDDDKGNRSGSVYVFNRTAGVWSQGQKLTASDGEATDLFGISIALQGTHALIGAPGDTNPLKAGSVYAFELEGGIWVEKQHIDSASPIAFGASLKLDGDLAYVSAVLDGTGLDRPGAVYVYQYASSLWTQVNKLTASDGQLGDLFGASIQTVDDLVMVGAPGDDELADNSGSVYIYKRTGTDFTELSHFAASDGSVKGSFGSSMALHGNRLVVGAPKEDGTFTATEPGSVYVLERSGDTWVELIKLTTDNTLFDYFGISVAIVGDHIMVGAYGEASLGARTGAAYAFDLTFIPVELIVNGGFETVDPTNPKLPLNWSGQNLTKDKLKCNNELKQFAHTGECAFMFKGSFQGGTGSLLQLPTADLQAGQFLTLSAWIDAYNVVAGPVYRIKLLYADNTKARVQIKLDTGSNGAYQVFTKPLQLPQDVVSIKVQIMYRGASGKYFIDDLSLMQSKAPLPANLIPLPVAR